MTESNVSPLRVGIVGVHANWRKRFRAALAAERDRFTIRWLYDETYQRAAIEARALGVPAADGLVELMTDPELDAVILLEDQWFRLWPVEVACHCQKPVFCVPYLANDSEHFESIYQQLKASQARVNSYRPARKCAVTRRLTKLLASRLGAARMVFWHSTATVFSLADAVDWCLHVFAGQPLGAQKLNVGPADNRALQSVVLEFGEGRVAQLNFFANGQAKPAVRILAEHGGADLRLPNRLAWTLQGSVFRERLRQEMGPERQALREFHAYVTGESATPLDWESERKLCAVMKMINEAR